jgi:hypothetical protein
MPKNLSFMLNDSNYDSDGNELHRDGLPRVDPKDKPAKLKHVKDMTPDEYKSRLDELTNPKLKVAIHTIAKHASTLSKEEYERELAILMDCFR